MFRIPVKSRLISYNTPWRRFNSSSGAIRSTFIEYFTANHNHKYVKSSSVVPLSDPTVPFVNAGMNQFKGVFLGKCAPPTLRVVNSQKCVRVGGKHNDLDAVGLDGSHHTFFEMLGNWSFGDYRKKEACQMAWELLLGPYRLRPENLVVTYFSGDAILGLQEDRECRDIWKSIGVKPSQLKAMDAKETFWEMGMTGPCGPCTEIHHVNPDGSLTEIWNIVFIQYNRESDGTISPLNKHHVDTGMGLERMAALLQSVPSNYDTDLFQPIIKAIHTKSNQVSEYGGGFDAQAQLDAAYRRLADHARMISVCLADCVFPASSLNLKQIMRRSFKISEDIFKCKKGMLSELYSHVAVSLGPAYPELYKKERDAKKIILHEEEAYAKLRSNLTKQWKDLIQQHPEVEQLHDVELANFAHGYREFKKAMAANKTSTIPGDVVFKLYDTYGFHEGIIDRVAALNNFTIDKTGFRDLLTKHKFRHKTSFKERNNNNMASSFDETIERLNKSGIHSTDDNHKYDYSLHGDDIVFEPLKTNLVAMLNENGHWLDFLEVNEAYNYYLVMERTNFYCENGGQNADTGVVDVNSDVRFIVESVFKIRDYVFHKGRFVIKPDCASRYVKLGTDVVLRVDSERRLKTMKNHTAIHLLNAALRKVLPNSVVCQIGSNVSESGFVLNLSVYGDKLTHKIVLDAQDLVKKVIQKSVPVQTSVLDSLEVSGLEDLVTVPGEVYPETGLRLIEVQSDLLTSRELCCGTHLPNTKHVGYFCVSQVKGAGSQTPAIYALTGEPAQEVHEVALRTQRLLETAATTAPARMRAEVAAARARLRACAPRAGAAFGDHAAVRARLDRLARAAAADAGRDGALDAVAEAEMLEVRAAAAARGRRFVVHFLRCSYLMERACVEAALRACGAAPALVLGCANGIIHAAGAVPENYVTKDFTAEKWMSCILPVFQSQLAPLTSDQSPETIAFMVGAKVSLITCEQLVHDAMRAAIRYAERHTRERPALRPPAPRAAAPRAAAQDARLN